MKRWKVTVETNLYDHSKASIEIEADTEREAKWAAMTKFPGIGAFNILNIHAEEVKRP